LEIDTGGDSMSRQRLTSRTASDMKSKPGTQVEDKGSGINNDVYEMNDTNHEKNDPKLDEYAKGDPEAWAEGVNKDNPAKDDSKRNEMNVAPLIDKHAAAIADARRLEEKAVKAIIASQRMLPGATDEIIEKQAGILMHLPDEGLNATLSNQENFARTIAKAASEVATAAEEEEDDDEKKEEKDAATEEKDEKDASEESLSEKLAALEGQISALKDQIKSAGEDEDEKAEEDSDKDAADEDSEKEDEEDSDKDAAEEKPEEKEAGKEEDDDETEACSKKEASNDSLLDQIFSGVMPSPVKKGASKLSGMVKKEASAGSSNDLSSLWSSAPDVSEIFS